jgi:hypothetical protein
VLVLRLSWWWEFGLMWSGSQAEEASPNAAFWIFNYSCRCQSLWLGWLGSSPCQAFLILLELARASRTRCKRNQRRGLTHLHFQYEPASAHLSFFTVGSVGQVSAGWPVATEAGNGDGKWLNGAVKQSLQIVVFCSGLQFRALPDWRL